MRRGKQGEVIRSQVFDRCPWGLVQRDPAIGKWLSAYGIAEAFPELGQPPGRRDPQLLEAFVILKVEHTACTREELTPRPGANRDR